MGFMMDLKPELNDEQFKKYVNRKLFIEILVFIVLIVLFYLIF